MEEKELKNNDEIEIDLRRILEAVLKKTWLVVLAAVVGAVLSLLITVFAITPQYESAAMFYVNNNALSVGDASFSISSGDLSTSRNLVESYIVILKTRESLNDVIDYAGVDRSYKEIKEMISAAAVNETEIFEVVVTSPDPAEAEKIANAIAYILPKRISSIIEGTSAKVVDAAVVPVKPSSPSYTKNTVIGFLLGFILVVGLIALEETFDVSIREDEDISLSCKHPILASVPDMLVQGKGGHDYSYDRKKKGTAQPRKTSLMGSNMSFAANEAYKLLRTKLQFSFAGDNSCRVIGLSSALSGEGKSLTSINLAYSLSQLDKKVILIDCDMRRPTLAEKLNIRKKPGLSSHLTGQCGLEELVQYCGIAGNEQAFHVIAAGQNPPNPVELLSSDKMNGVLDTLRQRYDYVIMDLPPVGEVTDAMAVAKAVDGMLLVVRQNYCNRIALNDAVQQFDFIGTKMLGVVFNCTSEGTGKGYYKKGYYRKGYYYRGYYRKYAHSGYENNDRSVDEQGHASAKK